MASYRTYWTPLNGPCGAETAVRASMRPAALAGDATAVVTTTTKAWMRIVRDEKLMEVLRYSAEEKLASREHRGSPVTGAGRLSRASQVSPESGLPASPDAAPLLGNPIAEGAVTIS